MSRRCPCFAPNRCVSHVRYMRYMRSMGGSRAGADRRPGCERVRDPVRWDGCSRRDPDRTRPADGVGSSNRPVRVRRDRFDPSRSDIRHKRVSDPATARCRSGGPVTRIAGNVRGDQDRPTASAGRDRQPAIPARAPRARRPRENHPTELHPGRSARYDESDPTGHPPPAALAAVRSGRGAGPVRLAIAGSTRAGGERPHPGEGRPGSPPCPRRATQRRNRRRHVCFQYTRRIQRPDREVRGGRRSQ